MLDRVLSVYSPDDTPSSLSTTNAINDGDEGVLPYPECGKMFKTNRARACHRTSAHYRHKKYHPARCLVLDCKCPACSQEFRSQADAESHFLARACAASRSEAWTEKLKQAWEAFEQQQKGSTDPQDSSANPPPRGGGRGKGRGAQRGRGAKNYGAGTE